MKKLHRYASLLLALAMAFALAMPAMAAGEGKITIDNATEGETYTIYKIFELVSYSNETSTDNPEVGTEWNGNFVYKVTDDWKPFVEAHPEWVTLAAEGAEAGYVTEVSSEFESNPAAFAEAALAWAKENNIANQGQQTAASTTVEFTGLDLGYYLLDSSMGTLCSLNTTAPEVTIKEKNDEPTLDKEVKEGDTWGKDNNASIGDTVEFRVKFTAKKGAVNYVMHDKMSAGLTFSGVGSIKVYSDAELATEIDAANYTATAPGTDADCTFEVKFDDEWLAGVTANGDYDIYVYYTATLNSNAQIAPLDNPNDSKLTYGNTQETEWSQTKTYTYEFDLVKYDGGTKDLLDGAEFTLAKADGELIHFELVDGVYRVKNGDAADGDTTITVTNGQVKICGLDAGTYTLTETKAPAGYNPLPNPVEIVIAEGTKQATVDGAETTVPDRSTATVNGAALTVTLTPEGGYGSDGVGVANNSGTVLPETGGIGTTIFYVVGGILVVAAGILLVTKKRMSNQG